MHLELHPAQLASSPATRAMFPARLRSGSALLFAGLLFTGLAFLAGCGGGGSSGSVTPPGGVGGAPTAAIGFPPSGVVTDAASLFVRGSSMSSSTITSVEVGGIAAATADGYKNWTAFVPLTEGASSLSVRTEDSDGLVDTIAAEVLVARVPFILAQTVGVAYDGFRNDLLLLDSVPGTLLRVDLQTAAGSELASDIQNARALAVHAAADRVLVTAGALGQVGVDITGGVLAFRLSDGARSELSGPHQGLGPRLDDPLGIAVNALGNVAYVADGALSEIVAIELSTGNRSIVAATGPAADDPLGVAFDPTRNRLLVTARAGLALWAIELGAGTRIVLSNAGVGNGPAFALPLGVRYDALGDRYIVTDGELGAIFAVDPFIGNRSILSDAETGGGPLLASPVGLAFDGGGRLFTADSGRDALLQVSTTTGNRTSVFDTSFSSGPLIANPVGLALAFSGEVAYVADRVGVYGVAIGVPEGSSGGPQAGERRLISGGEIGVGPEFMELTGLARLPEPVAGGSAPSIGADPARMFVTDRLRLAVLSVGDKGARAIVSGPAAPGPALVGPRSIALLPDSFGGPGSLRAVVCDYAVGAGQLIEVDLESGERRLLSGPAHGGGPALARPAAAVGAPDGERLWTIDIEQDRVYEVRLPSGNRDILSESGIGTSLAGDDAADLVLDEVLNRLLAVSGGNPRIVSIDLASGLRSVVTGPAQGAGPLLVEPTALGFDGSTLFVSDRGRASVFGVDVASGQRVLVTN